MALVYGVQTESGDWFGADPSHADWTRQGQLQVPPGAIAGFAGRVVPVRYGAIESVPGCRVQLADGTTLHLTAEVETFLAYPDSGEQP